LRKGRPAGRNPVVAVRVPPPLRQAILDEAKASERTMSAEVEALLRAAIDIRKRYPHSVIMRAYEGALLASLLSGASYARDIAKINEPWWDNLESRREAWMAACQSLLMFVSADPMQQKAALEALIGRVAFQQINFPQGRSAS
jgi:hypothetical protein